MSKLVFKEIKKHECGMPILIMYNEEIKRDVYLSPFRLYRFQISDTFDGQGDSASSEVIGLNNLFTIGCTKGYGSQSNAGLSGTVIELLEAISTRVITKYCYNHKLELPKELFMPWWMKEENAYKDFILDTLEFMYNEEMAKSETHFQRKDDINETLEWYRK